MISEDYRKQQQALHADKKINYGTTGAKYGPTVSEMIDVMEIDTLLDYGAGHNLSLKSTLAPQRSFSYQAYDPGVPDLADPPSPAEMVVAIDCLEHIEPDFIDDVLDHLESLTEKFLFATVHMGPAGKVLPDGRNAHLIQKPPEWWLPKIMERFTLKGYNLRDKSGFEVLCLARGDHLRNGWGTDANKSGFKHF